MEAEEAGASRDAAELETVGLRLGKIVMSMITGCFMPTISVKDS